MPSRTPFPDFAAAPPAYRLVRWLSRRALRWHYRHVDVLAASHLAGAGPLLVLLTHPNDLPDVLAGYAVSPRPLRYVATASMTRERIADATYRALGVIPITRVKDARALRAAGADPRALNAAAFARAIAAFVAGDAVAGFPEGGVHAGPHLAPLRTGLARMALAAASEAGAPIRVVPVAIHYDRPAAWRSDLVVAVGDPFPLTSVTPREGEPADAALMRTVQTRFWQLARLAPDEGARRRRLQAAAIDGAILRAPDEPAGAAAHRAWHAPLTGDAVDAARAALGDSLTACGIDPWSVHDVAEALEWIAPPAALARSSPAASGREGEAEAVRGAADATSLFGRPPGLSGTVLRVPFALAGALLHAPPWWLTGRLADALARGRDAERAARRCVPGLYVVVAWYALLGLLVALVSAAIAGWGWSLPAAAALLAALPRLGDAALVLLDALARRRRRRAIAARVRRDPAWHEAVRSAVDTLRAAARTR